MSRSTREGAAAICCRWGRGVVVGGDDDAAEAAALDLVAVGGADVDGEEVEAGGTVVEVREGGRGKLEAEVFAGDEIVSKDDGASEYELRYLRSGWARRLRAL